MIADALPEIAAPQALTAAALLAAPCAGSFAALVADRWPRGAPIAFDRSRCDACGRPLAARDLAPILSFAALRGAARCCGAPIPRATLAAELAALGLALWAFAVVPTAPLLVASCLLGWTLLALALVDLRCLRLPDMLTAPLAAGGLAVAALGSSGAPFDHLAAAALGYAAIAGVGRLWRALRGVEGVGMGDAKMLAAAGAWVGTSGLASVLLWACAAGLIWGAAGAARGAGWRAAIPFGPPLALGTWVTWLHGPLVF